MQLRLYLSRSQKVKTNLRNQGLLQDQVLLMRGVQGKTCRNYCYLFLLIRIISCKLMLLQLLVWDLFMQGSVMRIFLKLQCRYFQNIRKVHLKYQMRPLLSILLLLQGCCFWVNRADLILLLNVQELLSMNFVFIKYIYIYIYFYIKN